MRVRDHDPVDPAAGLQGCDRLIAHQADTFPEDVAGIRGQKKRSLVDGEIGGKTNAQQPRLLLKAQLVAGAKEFMVRLALPLPAHVLPVIEADGTFGARSFGILDSAGLADRQGRHRSVGLLHVLAPYQ